MRSLLSTDQVAQVLGKSRRQVEKYCASRELGHYRIGRTIRVSEAQIQAFLDRREDAPLLRLVRPQRKKEARPA